MRAEWQRLRRDPAALERAAGWGIVCGRVEDLDQVLAGVGFDTAAERARDDAFRRLVLHAADDELAARIVVQRLLPGLIAAAVRRLHLDDQALGELIGAAWIAIRTFSPERTPGNLAAALIADADYLAYRRSWRAVGSREVPIGEHGDLAGATDDADTDPPTELRDVLAEARRAGVPDEDLALLQQIAEAGTAALAAALQVTPRTVRNRRDRATSRLRAAIAA
jgi:DNA-directed RNA polymerase specialized sigma24 family protein